MGYPSIIICAWFFPNVSESRALPLATERRDEGVSLLFISVEFQKCP